MFKNKDIILLALSFSLFLGCSQTGTIDLALNENISLTRLEPEHRGKVKEFTSKNKEYKELQNWLKNNKEGWRKIETETYPKYLVHSGKFFIGIVENNVIILHKRFVDSTIIYQKPLKANELSFLNRGSFRYKDES